LGFGDYPTSLPVIGILSGGKMIESKRGKIIKELFARPGIRGYLVAVENKEARCLSYPDLVGEINVGDEVLLNTTAIHCDSVSGGYHYIIAKLNSQGTSLQPGGHIIKDALHTDAAQVPSVEEEDSPHRAAMLAAIALRIHRYWRLPCIPCWLRFACIWPT
jgi:hypothetical protein